MKRHTKEDGFTIIELLVVILIIGFLSFLLIVTSSSFKQKERNNERQNDIKALHLQLEAYFAQNAKYPTLANMNDANWRKTALKSMESDWLKDPQGTNEQFVDKPTKNAYAYEVKAADNSPCDNTAKDCTQYVLTATLEGSGTFTRNNTN
jgi:prepilin-type N-terminal cleavage/methylation domain-containing protein